MSEFIQSLSQRLFWDVDPKTIDDCAHCRYVIQRVLERGSVEDIKATVAHYTLPFMIAEAQQIRSLDPVTLAFAACLGNVKEDTFRCYFEDMLGKFSAVGRAEKESGTPDGKMAFFYIDGVKVDCVAYDMYDWLEPPVEEDGIRLAGIKDIAAMKVNAITNRGTRKDFVDMARLLDNYSLVDIFAWYRKKYPAANPALAMRSMSYFVDAETMPMPKMLIPFDWEEAKDRIRAAVRKFAT